MIQLDLVSVARAKRSRDLKADLVCLPVEVKTITHVALGLLLHGLLIVIERRDRLAPLGGHSGRELRQNMSLSMGRFVKCPAGNIVVDIVQVVRWRWSGACG